MTEFHERQKAGPETGLPRRDPGSTLHESMPGLPGGVPHPVFLPRNSDVNTTAGSPGYEGAPTHYQGANGIQSFDVWDAYDMDRYRANAWKYVSRADKKGSKKNDIEKAIHYIEESIARLPNEVSDYLDMEDIELKPSVVLPAFGLDGLVYDATLDLLLSFTTPHPKTYLRSAKAQLEEYLFSLDV